MGVAQTVDLNDSASERCITWDEISLHTNRDSCWIVVDGYVYDVTKWLEKHPGGDVVILNSSGLDCTDVFNAYHCPLVRGRMLRHYRIGTVDGYKVTPTVEEYRSLAASIESSPLMVTNRAFYIKLVLWFLFLAVSVITCVIRYSDSFWVGSVLGGVALAVFFQQVAFVGHDLGHTAIFHDRVIDSRLGLFCGNLLTGVSMGWWKATHNTHHVTTNSITADPDIQHLPFFAVDKHFTESVFSTYHERLLHFGTAAKHLVPLQARLYYVVMAFARCNLYIQSYIFLLSSDKYVRRRVKTQKYVELAGLILFASWMAWLVSFIPFISWRIAFLCISHTLAGILHVQITLSHFSMAVYSEKHQLAKESFLEHQLKTSLDVDCYPWLDWFHGGLQFQVAHHLFPRIPRCNLRELRRIVMTFCKDHGLKYHCVDFVTANRLMISHLAQVGDVTKREILSDILNMRG